MMILPCYCLTVTPGSILHVQVIILGTGKAKFEREVRALDMAYPGRAKGVCLFSAPLAHLMTAGADFILVPSRFEPCGECCLVNGCTVED